MGLTDNVESTTWTMTSTADRLGREFLYPGVFVFPFLNSRNNNARRSESPVILFNFPEIKAP